MMKVPARGKSGDHEKAGSGEKCLGLGQVAQRDQRHGVASDDACIL